MLSKILTIKTEFFITKIPLKLPHAYRARGVHDVTLNAVIHEHNVIPVKSFTELKDSSPLVGIWVIHC